MLAMVMGQEELILHERYVCIALVLFARHMFGVVWTGYGINPTRAFSPYVTAA